MKKYLKYIVWLVFPMLMLGACSGEDVVGPSIVLKTNNVSVNEDGGVIDLKFTSTMDWTAKSNQSWCTVSQNSGSSGDYTLKLTVDRNYIFKGREAVITLKTGTATETVTEQVIVSQTQHGAVTLVIKHHIANFTVPVFEILQGNLYVEGTIRWGDGKSEDYSNLASHNYADNKEHSVSIELTGVDAVEMSNITGITEIDFTNF